MPRAIKPKSGHGRTAVKAPVTLECLQEINSQINQEETDIALFTETEIDALYGRLRFRYASLSFDDTRPAEPEQKAAVKKLDKAAQQLVKAARKYEICLDNLDIQTAKHFQISILGEALEQAEKLHMQAMVVAHGLRERSQFLGRPVKELQRSVAALLINEIEAKHKGMIVDEYPEISHGVRRFYARYNRPAFRFIQSCMEKVFPKAKPGTIKKIILAMIDQKFKFST